VAHWNFDESSGTVVHDHAGNYNGTFSATGASFVANGVSGNALYVSKAQNGYVDFGNVLAFADTNCSFSIWIKMNAGDTTDSSIPIAKHYAGYENGYFLCVNKSAGRGYDNRACFFDGGTRGVGTDQAVFTTSGVNDGRWHHIVGTHQSGGVKAIYVD